MWAKRASTSFCEAVENPISALAGRAAEALGAEATVGWLSEPPEVARLSNKLRVRWKTGLEDGSLLADVRFGMSLSTAEVGNISRLHKIH